MTADTVELQIRVSPGTSKTKIGGVWADPLGPERLVVRVSAAPEGGKANKAALMALAKALGVPKAQLLVAKGQTSRLKTVVISAPPADYAARIKSLLGAV